MQLHRAKRRLPKASKLTPLIDIIFLLLIFFVLSSTFVEYSSIDMNSGRTALKGSGTETADHSLRPTPDVIVRVGVDGAIDVNGSPVTKDALTSTLDAYYNDGARRVVLSVAKSATVQDLVYALEMARLSRFKEIEMIQ